MRHDLKTWLPYFDAVLEGRKNFEVRLNDRNYEVGDWVRLLPYDTAKQKIVRRLGVRHIDREITYIMQGGQFGLAPDYVVLAIPDND
jgi:hypothetical protein